MKTLEHILDGGEGSKKKKCPVCGDVKTNTGNLNCHMVSKHTVGKVPIPCTKGWCSSTFPTLWEMILHRKSCVWHCDQCGHTTYQTTRVAGHMKKCYGASRSVCQTP